MNKIIVIDLRPLLANPYGGVPEYTRQLLRALLPLCEQKKVGLVLFSSGMKQLDMSFLGEYKGKVSNVYLRIPNRLLNPIMKVFGHPKLDSIVKKRYGVKGDIIWFAPNSNLMPLSGSTRLVVTVHDLSFERYPFFLNTKERLWHKAINPRRLAKRADQIIAVSESTKQDLISIYGIHPQKISVIYSGIGDEFEVKRIKNKELRIKNLLYLGSTEGRKNVNTLERAFALVKQKIPHANLIIAGPPRNSVSAKKRLELLQSADVFVYPSIFEGFGLPPLEAMKCGVPVIASHTSSFPEALQDAAILVNPHRVQELAQAMEMLLTDEKLRKHYIAKGLERVKKFTWSKAAKETLQILLK